MDINKMIADELNIRVGQVEKTVALIDEGNTIPFIARYRKEVTGALNDEVLRALYERLTYLRGLQDRKETVLESISEQGKLTDELRKQIEEVTTLVALEDLYRPYKQKRATRADVAKKKGLEPLAEYILKQDAKQPLEVTAAAYVDPEKEVEDVKQALQGAADIIAERISDNAAYRAYIRDLSRKKGVIRSKAKDPEAESVFEMYYDYEEPVSKIVGHRVLALNRGEEQKCLSIKLDAPKDEILKYLAQQEIIGHNEITEPFMESCIEDAYTRLIAPAIERELRGELTEAAEDGAISVFGKNLEQLLLQKPISGKVVLGWDPAFRTGCKLAVVDATGKVLDTKVIFPTAPQNKVAEAKEELKKLIKKYHVDLISLGNGTASRESEQVIVELLKELPERLSYVIVNEAGASVYSASKLATEEFPNFDVGQRSAASIARRLQDPLSELVKIEPKAIGVGQYQHDMNQKKLETALQGVVERSVNNVGVDLNTASAALLSYVAGVSSAVAKNIVAYREEKGRFGSRKELLKVPKLGPKAFEQCAGFLRIPGAAEPLDATAVHPESYDAARGLMSRLKLDIADFAGFDEKKLGDKKKLAEELGIGSLTLDDIIKELKRPGRDPREDMPAPILRTDILELEDLAPGMVLKGTVRNAIDFGIFVDIGVHQDGLVHISQISDHYIKHPLDAVSVGDIVEVKVLEVDVKRKRISLTMKGI